MQRFFASIVAIIAVFGSVSVGYAQTLPTDPASPAGSADVPLLINTPTIAPLDTTPAAVDSVPVGDSPQVASQLTAMSAVAKGQELLAPVLADFKSKEAKVKPLATKTGATAAALAVWDKKADTVTVYGGTRGAKYFTADGGKMTVPIVSVAGAQTAYRDSDPNLVVVGTVQAAMVKATVKKKTVYKPSFSYYVPFNSELYSTETLAAGSDYLSFLIKDAFAELDSRGIKSRSFPDQALTSVIDPYLIKSIAVIEHADGQIYEDNKSEDALGRFLVKLALNKEDALGTATSSAGARGMVQFIPSTYKLMVTKRTDLGLIPDFAKGMADHRNAIKAEAAYLDMILADLPESVRAKYAVDKGSAASYIAAGYNGGSARVKKAIAAWGDSWSAAHMSEATALASKAANLNYRVKQIDKKLKTAKLTAKQIAELKAERKKAVADAASYSSRSTKIKSGSLYTETVNYVVKLRRVYDMLAAGFFATPTAPANTVPVASSGSVSIAMGSVPMATNP